MAKVQYVQADGTTRSCDCFEGMTVMQLGVANLVEGIDALCGGMRQCGTCHVYVDHAWFARVGPAGPEEQEMLGALAEAIEVRATSRLSCQIHIDESLDGLLVEVPASQPGV
jgi:2Fe-2S ferredoxin